jgi:hypothetical protein
VLRLLREHRVFFLATILAALALRLFFFHYFPVVTDDSHSYANFATNWLQHGIYGQTQIGPQPTNVAPSDARLPGYPAFLAAIFCLFGVANFKAALLAQILFDLGTCFIVADLARRAISGRAARIAFVLTALCPFLANYAAAALTETLEIFFTALALDCATAAVNRMREGWLRVDVLALWASTGAAIAACILLRPDGGLLLAAVLIYIVYVAASAPKGMPLSAEFAALLKRNPDAKLEARPAIKLIFVNTSFAALIMMTIVAAFALAPLAPWAIRNFRAFHHFQPLAPRYANDPGKYVPRGFNRWAKTWIAEYVSVEEIYWRVPGDVIDPLKLPSRAIENENANTTEKDLTLAAIAAYNQSQEMTPDVDARFAQIAAERVRAHPVRYYIVLPVLRIADMWLRPRTEILPPDVRWWEFNDDTQQSAMAVGFGLLNLAYLAAALLALVLRSPSRPAGIRYAGLLLGFLLLRSAFLGSLENPEPRYTLECYPVVIVLASSFLARRLPE